jgi:lipopolysaccharide biosynthesis protein
MKNKKHAIILHLFYIDLWAEMKSYIEPILNRGDIDLYVSITEGSESIIPELEKYVESCFVLPNKGLDIGPFVYILNYIKDLEYSTVTKIHTKKSLHHGQSIEFGEKWRKSLIKSMIGDLNIFNGCVNEINKNELTLIGSNEYYFNFENDKYNIPHHYSVIKEALNLLQIDITETPIVDNLGNVESVKFGNGNFIAGSMFITSHAYLKLLFKNSDMINLYESLPDNYHRNSVAHAIERIFGFYVEQLGGIIIKK